MGWWILGGVLLLVLAFGGYRRLTDGRARAVADSRPRLDATRLGGSLGAEATFVQFSTSLCAPCRATRRLLVDLTAAEPRVAHIDIDAETRLDLVEEFGIMRTPTVLLLDADGVPRHRIVGPARRREVVAALHEITGRTSSSSHAARR
jgi:thiol-disulfide isomerase/thioredoxin